ncbi:MAG TPA: dUTP diphosphatase [Turneriella sp.]|nr:dUTP diphosphatase [Turneriella sp.]HNA78010.1 dUTP diphosphatase [Turneriella sp.]HNE19777.1 dUTP diphosphatase [Turneriella sp.]HNL10806.1 dUTP diphosphatase [Turneriella sp.]HNL53407.1 dUTP diphosphatase [Turneriella sp.]
MSSITVKFTKLNPGAMLPGRQSVHAAGYDVHACLEHNITIKRGSITPVPTGIAVEIPPGYHISIRARSGMAVKHGLTPVNTPGTIDADYRGEIFVPLINLGNEDYTIKNGDRIAQMLLEKTYEIYWQEGSLSETARGEGKFGSTGKR